MDNATRKVNPLIFFSVTYLLSWLIWIPLDLSHFQLGGLDIPEATSGIVRLFGVLMPAVAGLILTRVLGGREGYRSLISRLGIWRVEAKWWLAAGLIQPALLVLSALAYGLIKGMPLSYTPPGPVAGIIVNIIFLLLATLGEEIGWRGVALPSLLTRHSPVNASIILGLVWGAWHIPFWLLLDTFDQFGWMYLALNLVFGFPLTFFITWIFIHTRGSLLLPVVIHLTFNIVNTIFLPVTLNLTAFAMLGILEWLFALLILRWLNAEQRIVSGKGARLPERGIK
jgi:membrane protease YdiL (CAAX protease family)